LKIAHSPTPQKWTQNSRPENIAARCHGLPWGVKDLFAVKGTTHNLGRG